MALSSARGPPRSGDADILLVPDLEAGNMLAKELTFFADAVLGARVPIVLTSGATGGEPFRTMR
jgi:phosphate acetyltransferase